LANNYVKEKEENIMLTIYGFDFSSPANKVRFAANAMGLIYEYKRVNLMAGEQKTPEFLKLNPTGRVPAIDDDGFKVFESAVIIKYLADKNNSPLYPKDLQKRTIVDQWIDFTNIHVAAALQRVTFNRVFFRIMNIEKDERSLSDGLKFLDVYLPVLEKQLTEAKFLAGNEMTLADINLLATLDPAELSSVDLSIYPSLFNWRKNLRTQSFYTKCHSSLDEVLQAMTAGAGK
jgi:glutathione S-transferase